MPLPKSITDLAEKTAKAIPTGPVWKGPQDQSDRGGITFSLLSRFLVCRERFRLMAVKGLKPKEGFNHRLEYGNMWHACEEALGIRPWEEALEEYAHKLSQKYPFQRQQVTHWYNVCRVQYPIYLKWWGDHKDDKRQRTIFSERVFHVPYTLPSGRTVYLRGKWDKGLQIAECGKWLTGLMEHKTKSDIDFDQLRRQLTYDLQTMIYATAWDTEISNNGSVYQELVRNKFNPGPTRFIKYNVIRRPLSSGKGNIKPHQEKKYKTKTVPAETEEEYYNRLSGIIESAVGEEWGMPKGQHYFFQRLFVPITADDITRFRRECLDPILEQLCDWWGWVSSQKDPFKPVQLSDENGTWYGLGLHSRHPYGCYNVLDQGGISEMDHYLDSGSEIGLNRVDNLFPELQ